MRPRSFRYLLTRANADCLVAETGGHVSGYAAVFYRLGTKVARLHSIAVDPRAQRNGIGGKLLAAIEIAARRYGAETLRLAVRKDNRGAARLYLAFGYSEIGVEPRYYSDGMAALTMEKSLAAA
jgi:ribosomal protein S18 acetylase RimI-like enzyme